MATQFGHTIWPHNLAIQFVRYKSPTEAVVVRVSGLYRMVFGMLASSQMRLDDGSSAGENYKLINKRFLLECYSKN